MSTGGGPPFMPGDPTKLSCSSVTCATAQAAAIDAGNAITAKCSDIAAAKARADAMLTVALALIGAAVALAAVLVPIIGAAATIAIFITVALTQQPLLFWAIITVIATVFVFLALYAAFSIQVAVLQADLAGLRSAFTTAAHKVMTACPNSCWGNLQAPVC